MSKRGLRKEHQVRDWLLEQDFWVCRAAGSLGDADLVALKIGDRRLVEVKATAAGPYATFGPFDRADLIAAARIADADAWLAWWPPRGKLHWIHESEFPVNRSKSAAK